MVSDRSRPLPFLLLVVLVLSIAGCGYSSANRAMDGLTPAGHHTFVGSSTTDSGPVRLRDGMGRVDFPITTRSNEAQAFFNQGMAQLYGFWFVEAERSFLQAAKLDPRAAMAYWGIALAAPATFVPMYQLALIPHRPPMVAPPNSPEARARAAIATAQALDAAITPRERLYIAAVAAWHDPHLPDPDAAYVSALKRLVESFPDDLHAKSILALALANGYDASTKSPKSGTTQSLQLLRAVLSTDGDHVGALHFLTHALEGGKDVRDALPSAERYAALAPNIPHALHMPGHIYAQLGMFDDAVKAFVATAAKEQEYRSAGAALYSRLGHLHNELLLLDVLGTQGRYSDAMSRIADLMSATQKPSEQELGPIFYQVGWFALVTTLVRFEKWPEILNGTLPYPAQPSERVWYHWARGLAYASSSNVAEALSSLDRMRQLLGSKSIPPELQIATSELEAYVAAKAGDVKKGLEGLEHAATLEGALPYTDPALYPRPVLELLGRTALDARDFQMAESAYRRALDNEPGNGRALWGLAKALERLHKRDEAETVLSVFRRTWRGEELR